MLVSPETDPPPPTHTHTKQAALTWLLHRCGWWGDKQPIGVNIQDLVTDQLLSVDLHLHQLGQVLAGLVLPPQESAAATQYGQVPCTLISPVYPYWQIP